MVYLNNLRHGSLTIKSRVCFDHSTASVWASFSIPVNKVINGSCSTVFSDLWPRDGAAGSHGPVPDSTLKADPLKGVLVHIRYVLRLWFMKEGILPRLKMRRCSGFTEIHHQPARRLIGWKQWIITHTKNKLDSLTSNTHPTNSRPFITARHVRFLCFRRYLNASRVTNASNWNDNQTETPRYKCHHQK